MYIMQYSLSVHLMFACFAYSATIKIVFCIFSNNGDDHTIKKCNVNGYIKTVGYVLQFVICFDDGKITMLMSDGIKNIRNDHIGNLDKVKIKAVADYGYQSFGCV